MCVKSDSSLYNNFEIFTYAVSGVTGIKRYSRDSYTNSLMVVFFLKIMVMK